MFFFEKFKVQKTQLRDCFDLSRKFCHGDLRYTRWDAGLMVVVCFYQTLMPTVCNLQSRRDLRSVKEPMDMRVWHPIGMLL